MKLGSESPVVIFTKSNCCMSHSIDTLIRGYGANPKIFELDRLADGAQMEKDLMALGCNPSVPAVFIDKEFVGGSNEIISLEIRAQLKPLLIKAKAIWV